jgi:hypothetical protein
MMPVLLNAHLNAKYSCWFRPRAPAMCAAPKRAHHLSITLFGACPISASLEQLEKCSNIGVTAAIVQEMDAYVFPVICSQFPCYAQNRSLLISITNFA